MLPWGTIPTWGRNVSKYKSHMTENKKILQLIGFFSDLEGRKATYSLQNEAGH